MFKIDSAMSNRIANFSFAMTCLVVLIHMPSGDGDASFEFMHRIFPRCITDMAVPSFFLISGFLLAGHCEDVGWWRKAVHKRVRTLIIPYLIFNVCYWPLKQLVHLFAHDAGGVQISWRLPLEIIGLPFCGGPANGPLWYISCLFYFVIVSPIFVAVIRKGLRYFVGMWMVVVLVYLAWELLCCRCHVPPCLSEFLYFGFSLWGLCFFVLGIGCRYYFKPISPRLGFALLASGICLALVNAYHGIVGANMYFLVPALLMIFGGLSISPTSPGMNFFVGQSFAIFVMHQPMIYFTSAVLKALNRYASVHTGIGYLIYWIVMILLTSSLAWGLKRFFPRFSGVLFGGR